MNEREQTQQDEEAGLGTDAEVGLGGPLSHPVKIGAVRGRNRMPGVRKAIDAAPMLLEELAGYFSELGAEQLASAWVACVLDAVWEPSWERGKLGCLARSLVVVAERLHGVRFDSSVIGGGMTRMQAQPMGGTKPQATFGAQVPAVIPRGTAAMSGDGFTVCDGAMPSLKRGKGVVDDLTRAMVQLKDDRFITVDIDKYPLVNMRARVMKARKLGGDARMRCAESLDGKSVVVFIDSTYTPRKRK